MGLTLQFLESATLTASTPSPATVTVNTGLPGPQGPAGDAATINVASTTTLAPGSSATVTNVGTTSAASLAFGIPRGDVGPAGATGPTGPAGVGIAAGGSTGQVLAKTSNADYATGWVNLPDLTGYATQAWVNSQGFLTSSSLDGYATQSWVTGQGYITASALSPYLLSATAAATYLTQSNAASTYATQTALASYLTTAVASSTYQTLAGMSAYLTTATASTTYAPIAAAVPVGGTTGQVLAKSSNSDYALTWTTPASGSAVWGGISGTLSDQTDLNTALGLKAPIASPTFTGTVTIPAGASISGYLTTATASSTYATISSVSLKANTASPTFTGTVTIPAGASIAGYLTTASASTTYAPLASPTFTGDPKAPTPATADNDTSIATTAFVKAQGYAPIASPTFTGTVTIPAGASISGYLTVTAANGNYAPIASAIPGGSTGQVLTKVSSANYDSDWMTPAVGDRYSTTSNSTLSLSNGTKTLTIGSGLSYTPLQDVTIAYSTDPVNFHMHARVVSYSGTTLVVDVTQHTGTGSFTSWSVNVGGISSIATWGLISGNIADQTDLAAALSAKVDLAPNDGNYYLQRNGVWEVANIF